MDVTPITLTASVYLRHKANQCMALIQNQKSYSLPGSGIACEKFGIVGLNL